MGPHMLLQVGFAYVLGLFKFWISVP